MLELRQPKLRQQLLTGRLSADKGLAIFRKAAMVGLQRGLEDTLRNTMRAQTALKQAVDFSKRESPAKSDKLSG